MELQLRGLKVDAKGEGTRGGKIIGHTSSGKPIYGSHSHPSHGLFTTKDHRDAVKVHSKRAKVLEEARSNFLKVEGSRAHKEVSETIKHHESQAKLHMAARKKVKTDVGEGTRGGKVIGHTSSGKPIYESHGHPSHKEFTKAEHQEAAGVHGRKESLAIADKTRGKGYKAKREETIRHHGKQGQLHSKSAKGTVPESPFRK